MAQGALGASGPLWGWDGEGDDDWDAAALALLGLAVVAATALALHWLGFGQDQGEAGPAPAAHGGQPGLLPSAGGQRSGLERPEPGRRGHQSAAIAEARDPESPGVRDPAPLQMPGEAAGAETLGQGRITGPGSPQGKGRTSPRPDAALPGGSDAAAGTPAPLLIRFTPRSPGCSAGLRADAGAAGATHQIPFREEPPDASPPGRGQGGRRRRTEPGSRDRTSRRRRPDPLRLGTAASVWDAVDALGPRPSPGSEAAERVGLGGPEDGWPWVTRAVPVPGSLAAPCPLARGSGLPSTAAAPARASSSLPGVSHGSSVGETSAAPASSSAPTSGFAQVSTSAAIAASTPSLRPAPSSSLDPAPVLAPGSPPAPGSVPAPAPAPAPTPAPAPAPAAAPSSTPTPISTPDPASAVFPTSTPASTPAPASPPASGSTPAPPPAILQAPSSTPAPISTLAPAPPPSPTLAPPPAPGSTPASAPAILQAPASAAAPSSTPAPASTPAPTSIAAPASGSKTVSWGPSVGLSKGDREGQISTSWGNLIAMVLRSHPFPRQDRPQENAPKATPGSPTGPQTPTHLEDRLAGSGSEEAVSSFQDRPSSSLGTVPPAGAGGPAEAGCQMQPMSWETKGDPTLSPTPGPRGGGAREKGLDSVLPAALLGPSSQPPRQGQPGPTVSPVRRGDSPPVPKPRRKHSICEIAQSSEGVILQATLEPPQQPRPGQGARPASGKRILTEKQKDAQKLMVFLQRPGNWGVVEGPQNPHLKASESAVPWPQRLDLGSCLEVLAFAQQRGEPSLAQETYALMSSNLLRVLGDPHLYRQLSGAERERILSLRTRGGQTVLGVLVLPSLYQVGRSGLLRGSHRKEDPAAQPVPQVPRPHLHVFSPQDNRWWPLTQVPEEAPLRGCGLCTMYNYLFLAGGVRGSGAEAICSNEVFCYNPLTNIWSQVRPMQQARAQLKLVALDGLIYAIGGECLYSMERYDPRTDAWTSRAPLPAGTFPVAHEAVACRGDIYVTGGHLFYRLLRYSPMKDAWDECPYSASHRRSSDMVALGGFLYRFDLLRGVGAAVMRYNTVTGSWSRAASLPLPDPAPLRCTVLGNTIYCLNHQVTATFTVSEGTAQFQAKELQPFPMGSKGVLCPFILTLPPEARLQTSL